MKIKVPLPWLIIALKSCCERVSPLSWLPAWERDIVLRHSLVQSLFALLKFELLSPVYLLTLLLFIIKNILSWVICECTQWGLIQASYRQESASEAHHTAGSPQFLHFLSAPTSTGHSADHSLVRKQGMQVSCAFVWGRGRPQARNPLRQVVLTSTCERWTTWPIPTAFCLRSCAETGGFLLKRCGF